MLRQERIGPWTLQISDYDSDGEVDMMLLDSNGAELWGETVQANPDCGEVFRAARAKAAVFLEAIYMDARKRIMDPIPEDLDP